MQVVGDEQVKQLSEHVGLQVGPSSVYPATHELQSERPVHLTQGLTQAEHPELET